MIKLENLTKSYATKKGRHFVFRNLNITLPGGKSVALIGKNGAGKSTLLRIIGGIDHADSGQVVSNASISWPVGLAGGFQGSLTGRQNVRFVSRLFVPESKVDDIVRYVEDFAELGKYFDMPIKIYSSGMRSRLGFGLSMAFDFDYYLLDEVGAPGDAQFKAKSKVLLDNLKKNSNIIMVSHNLNDLTEHCDVALFVKEGNAYYFDSVEEAVEVYKEYALAQK
ncbi:ABC transporter ATP-binding protein [Alkanindiges illinoisensis]|uniref:ABC transporter ATP-binding protein n=1 Tax=Alkanindiges illinoisensis TaxID=197183 RepID=UPI00047E50B1|nr:ABC transporter ATP-binding protein [Alkanindiges illinoisensis]